MQYQLVMNENETIKRNVRCIHINDGIYKCRFEGSLSKSSIMYIAYCGMMRNQLYKFVFICLFYARYTQNVMQKLAITTNQPKCWFSWQMSSRAKAVYRIRITERIILFEIKITIDVPTLHVCYKGILYADHRKFFFQFFSYSAHETRNAGKLSSVIKKIQ